MGILSQQEFILYELGIALTDWDYRHTETYGTFQATNQELAEILGFKTDSSISRHKTGLLKKVLFILADEHRIAPKDFEKWELRKSAKMQNQVAEMQTDSANKHELSAKKQELYPQNSDYSLISYKGNIGSSNSEYISDDELDRIAIEIDKKIEKEKSEKNKPY